MRHDNRQSTPAAPRIRRRAQRVAALASAVFAGASLLGLYGIAGAQAPPPSATAPPAPVKAPEGQAESPSDAEDAALALRQKRDEVGKELQELARSMRVSDDKAAELEQSISKLSKTSESIRSALIESAGRRKDLERKIAAGEKKLAELGLKEDAIRASFRGRRAVLAEVLAALERMGRNPPPALLVSPEDALASVRTAILLGAVVPGIRHETEKLAADLAELVRLRLEGQKETEALVATIASRQEEERHMDLLLGENDRLSQQNALELATEKRRAEALAARASSMEGLIASLETEIRSVREAAEKARAEEEKLRKLSEEQRQKARELAASSLPDKNRIAPAYAFSDLKHKLELPTAGETLRQFGDPDGTGHEAKGMVIASAPGSLVTAPADAWVVYAGEFRSYGQMIILNTGDGYHVVLSGMDRISTAQGKFVLSGEPLAVMGEKRVASATALALETDRPTLYIEFRKDGKPVDSREWWTGSGSGKAQNDS
ncbi:murein hydrolase activator EnvC family protein [Sphingomonas psychrolutea]|uniref:murein hydrolase activator EnvC family protein n=1 Tax=Sphingomonas psychrolutea TaxID=1259676 RepID=UPI0025483D61|nr:murein hydrolase activator EnvC [Sphingomonas psychrolutea]